MTQATQLRERPSSALLTIDPGDYFSTARELYRVERVIANRVLIEDCRTESLIEVGVEQVMAMTPVVPAA